MSRCVFVERVWQHGDDAGCPGLPAHEGGQEVVEETLLCPASLRALLLNQRKLKGDWHCRDYHGDNVVISLSFFPVISS